MFVTTGARPLSAMCSVRRERSALQPTEEFVVFSRHDNASGACPSQTIECHLSARFHVIFCGREMNCHPSWWRSVHSDTSVFLFTINVGCGHVSLGDLRRSEAQTKLWRKQRRHFSMHCRPEQGVSASLTFCRGSQRSTPGRQSHQSVE